MQRQMDRAREVEGGVKGEVRGGSGGGMGGAPAQSLPLLPLMMTETMWAPSESFALQCDTPGQDPLPHKDTLVAGAPREPRPGGG